MNNRTKEPEDRAKGITQTPVADTSHYIDLLKYHHNAMESRRTIQLTIFTACIAFFLIVTKGLYDARATILATPWTPYVVGIFFVLLLVIYFYMLIRMEIASKFDREQYHHLEDCVRGATRDCCAEERTLSRCNERSLKKHIGIA